MQTHSENFHNAQSRDKGRNTPMVEMVVVNRNTLNLTVEGNVVPPGEHTIRVYKDDVSKVLALVEPDDGGMAQAKKHFLLKVAEGVKERAAWSGTIADLSELLKSDKLPDQIATAYKSVLGTTPRSFCASFMEVNGRGVNPLVSARVVEGSEQPDHAMVAKQQEARLLHAGIVAAVHAAVPSSPAQAVSPEAIQAMVEAMVAKELARLAGQGAEAKRPKA